MIMDDMEMIMEMIMEMMMEMIEMIKRVLLIYHG